MLGPVNEKAWKYSLFMRNPKERAGVLSRLTFCWINSILQIGNKRVLDTSDLYPLLDEDKSRDLTDKLEQSWADEIRGSRLKGRTPHLTRALMSILSWSEYALILFSLFIGVACNILEPLLLGLLLTALLNTTRAGPIEDPMVYVYSGGLCASSLLRVLVLNQFNSKAQLMGMRWRSAVTGLVYKKVLRLNQKEVAQASTDHANTLITHDTQRMYDVVLKSGLILQGTLELLAVSVLLWQLIGFQSLTGILFITMLIGYYVGMWDVCLKLRSRIKFWAERRMSVISGVVENLRYVKMNSWEWLYRDKAGKYRKKEMQAIQQKSAILSSFATFLYTATTVAVFISLTTVAVTGEPLTLYNIFMTIALMRTIRLSSSSLFASGIKYMGEFSAAASRIQTFLQIDEYDSLKPNKRSLVKSKKIYRSFLDLTKSEISQYLSSEDVNKIQTEIKKGTTLAVPEYTEEFRDANIETVTAFVSLNNVTCHWGRTNQETALQNLNMRANAKELTLINGPGGSGKSTLLLAVLGELPVTEGSILTEGRMVYVPQKPCIFSDSLRENIVFGRPFNPFRYQAVLNACNLQKVIEKLPDGDLTLIGSQGVPLTEDQRVRVGLARAAFADAEIYLLDDPLSGVDTKIAEQVFDKCICGLMSKRLRIMVSRHLQYVERADQILTMRSGTIIHEVTSPMMGYKSVKLHSVSDDRNVKSGRGNSKSVEFPDSEEAEVIKIPSVVDRPVENDSLPCPVQGKTYWKYFSAAMWDPLIVLCALLFFLFQVILIAPDVWLLYISHTEYNLMTSEDTWYVYASLVAGPFLLVILRATVFVSTALRSSNKMYNTVMEAVLKGPANMFTKNPEKATEILDSFSKDVSAMDEILPGVFLDALQGACFTITAILLPALLNQCLLLFAVPLVVLFVLFWGYYLRTARQVRKLEVASRIPLSNHFAEMLRGLAVIRSHDMVDEFTDDVFRYQDSHCQTSCTAVILEAWVALRIDLLCVMYLAAVVFGAHLMNVGPAFTGISLVYAIQMACELSIYGVKRCFDVENYMTSVQRLLDHSNIESEPGYDNRTQPHEPWPSAGHVVCDNVSLTYEKDGLRALKDLTFSVSAGEKIGIVGRNGSGKSSVIHALFRMPEIEGKILIDDVDIKGMNLQRSRQGISVITKDPVIFCGNVRCNVDPFSKRTDKEVWEALDKVHLKPWVETLPKQLYQDLAECSAAFSTGEKQLVALARALVYNTKILVLDEATSVVDYKTDRLVQEIIRSKFKNSTIITVPHRLSTIIDYDRVMVLDNGRIVEFDKPETLLKKSDGYFAHLYGSQCPT
ncbi:ATP-binding cassette sub-family C member 4 isoform X2 [Nematostella vectensis]|nr:ATP-binding cassette sub-family C member 4 isoform X2 [Nematostella vectensis]